MRKSIKVLGAVLLLLSITSFVFALTNTEKLNLLEERFLKGEISEKAYYELKKKYEGKKPEVSVPTSTANLLKNSSFEIDSNNDGIPDNWKSTNLSKTEVRFSLDKEVAHQGKQSVMIEFPTRGEGQWSQKIPVVGGKTYSFKCWMKSNMYRGDGCATMISRFLPEKGGVKEGVDWFTVGMYGNKDWTLFSQTAVAPPDAKEVEIKLRSHGMTGTIWFDDVEFFEYGKITTAASLKMDKDREAVVLENEFLKVKIVKKGGRVESLYDKRTYQQWAMSGKTNFAGLCKERLVEDKSNTFLGTDYTLKKIKDTAEEVIIEAEYRTDLKVVGGLTIEKRYTIFQDKPYLKVELCFRSEKKDISFTPWIHNYLPFGQTREGIATYFTLKDNKQFVVNLNYDLHEDIYIIEPQAAWLGMVSKLGNKGIVWLMEKDDIQKYYIWSNPDGSTLECIYKKKDLAKDKEWKTTYYIIPTQGLPSYSYVSKEIIVSLDNLNLTLLPLDRFQDASVGITSKGKEMESFYFQDLNPTKIYSKVLPEVSEAIETLNLEVKGREKKLSFSISTGVTQMPEERKEIRKGSIVVNLDSEKRIKKSQIKDILDKKGKTGKKYDQLSERNMAKLKKLIELPPLSEAGDTMLAILCPMSTLRHGFFLYRPGLTKVDSAVYTMKNNQIELQVNAKPNVKRSFVTPHCELQGVPDKDIIIKNLTTGEMYKYNKEPKLRIEYTVNKKIGKFRFGAPQNYGDKLEFRYQYWKFSPLDPKLTPEELFSRQLKDLTDLYCKNLYWAWSQWSATSMTQEIFFRIIKEVDARGIKIAGFCDSIDENGFGKYFGQKRKASEFYAEILPKLKGHIEQYVFTVGGQKGYWCVPKIPPEKYVAAVAPLCKVIKEANPEAKIISPLIDQFSPEYVKKMLDAGLAEHIDGFGMDIYGCFSTTKHPEAPWSFLKLSPDSSYSGELLAPFQENKYSPMDIHGFEKNWRALKKLIDSYKKDLWVTIGEWGSDFGYEKNWACRELPKYPAIPPEPTPDRKQYSELMKIEDFCNTAGLYNSAIMAARHGIIWLDLYRQLKMKGIVAYNSLGMRWYSSLALVNAWGERRPAYYAYQTVNKLLYNPYELETPQQINSLDRIIHSHLFLRNKKELILIFWEPYGEAITDIIINDSGFKYPVKVDLFDYDNLKPLDYEIIKDRVIIKDIKVTPEPFIIRLVKLG